MTEDGCKVCRTLNGHGRAWMEEELVGRWRGDEGERHGYRRLARWLNVTLLERAMERSGQATAGDEAASRYDRLTGDDEAVADGVRELLREGGVPIDDLEPAFVSYGVVRTHMLECLDAERPPSPTTDWEADAVATARSHATDRAGAAVRARFNKGRLAAGDVPDVEVTVTVRCPVCGESADAGDALDSGVLCDCDATRGGD